MDTSAIFVLLRLIFFCEHSSAVSRSSGRPKFMVDKIGVAADGSILGAREATKRPSPPQYGNPTGQPPPKRFAPDPADRPSTSKDSPIEQVEAGEPQAAQSLPQYGENIQPQMAETTFQDIEPLVKAFLKNHTLADEWVDQAVAYFDVPDKDLAFYDLLLDEEEPENPQMPETTFQDIEPLVKAFLKNQTLADEWADKAVAYFDVPDKDPAFYDLLLDEEEPEN